MWTGTFNMEKGLVAVYPGYCNTSRRFVDSSIARTTDVFIKVKESKQLLSRAVYPGTVSASVSQSLLSFELESGRKCTGTFSPRATPPSSRCTCSGHLTPTETGPSTSGSSCARWASPPAASWTRSCAGPSPCTTSTGTDTSRGRRW